MGKYTDYEGYNENDKTIKDFWKVIFIFKYTFYKKKFFLIKQKYNKIKIIKINK